MKLKLCYLAILSSALLFQGCGGGGSLLEESTDTDPIYPAPGVDDDSERPRPPENAAVLTTDDNYIYDVAGNPVIFRGINLNYGESPTTRIGGVTAISDTGSNVVRLHINEQTTETDLEGALAKIVAGGMVAVITLTDTEKLSCVSSNEYLLTAVDTLWLKKWIPILAQDRFQAHVMINIANSWGPADIFSSQSLGYQEYLDTYKALIRKFRDAGFKLPLVIDAPGCGEDYNAFLAGRGKELLAADQENNIVFSVHANGSRWSTSEKILAASTLLNTQKVPFILGAFAGSGVGESPVDHMDIMKKGLGDNAMVFNIPWVAADDRAAYVMALEEPLNLAGGSVLSASVYLDRLYLEFIRRDGGADYIQTGKLGIAPYIKDANSNTLRIGLTQAVDLRENTWNRLRFDLPKDGIDPENLLNGSTEFDLESVTHIGFEILANGKSASAKGDIKFDDLTILPGVPPMYVANFDADTQGWTGDAATVTQASGNLQLSPTAEKIDIKMGSDRSLLDFSKTLNVTVRMFLPEQYAADGLWFQAFAQFGPNWSWNAKSVSLAAVTPGQWSDLKYTINFNETVPESEIGLAQSFGFQIGNIGVPKTEPILIDSITIEDPAARPTKVITASQHKIAFTQNVEAFSALVESGTNWIGAADTTIVQANGELLITPDESTGSFVGMTKGDINSIQEINLTGTVTIKAKVFLPETYSGDTFAMKLFIQDGQSWTWFETPQQTFEAFTVGAWSDIEFRIEEFSAGFNRNLVPNAFGVIFDGIAGLNGGTIKVDDIEFVGDTVVDDSQPILDIGFSSQSEIDAFVFDPSRGGNFTESTLMGAKLWGFKIVPFGWMATTWIGSEEGMLDLSTSESLVELTPRGEEIVNGEAGIAETSLPVSFE